MTDETNQKTADVGPSDLSDVLAKERDLLRLLAIALHKLGGKMEITAVDYFEIQNKTFFSTRDNRGIGTLGLVDDKPATAFVG
jgi:hypothetical protein